MKSIFKLVQSIPKNTTISCNPKMDFNMLETCIDMINSAKKNLYIECFYIHVDKNVAFIKFIDAIIQAGKRGIEIAIIFEPNSSFSKILPVMCKDIPTIEFYASTIHDNYGGIMHTKCIISDGKKCLFGSHNFTESSFQDNFETSLYVENSSIYDVFFYVFHYDITTLSYPIDSQKISILNRFKQLKLPLPTLTYDNPVEIITDNYGTFKLSVAAGGKNSAPQNMKEYDIDYLINFISSAKKTLNIQIYDFGTRTLTVDDNKPWNNVFDAIVKASKSGVEVKLSVGIQSILKNKKTHNKTVHLLNKDALKNGLSRLSDTMALSKAGIQIKYMYIKAIDYHKKHNEKFKHEKDTFIGFFSHAKYMIADSSDAWVSTSNLEGSYFFNSRGFSAIIRGGLLPQHLDKQYSELWNSKTDALNFEEIRDFIFTNL